MITAPADAVKSCSAESLKECQDEALIKAKKQFNSRCEQEKCLQNQFESKKAQFLSDFRKKYTSMVECESKRR